MPDSQPNYLTIDPATGGVGANFAGHVQASGLDMVAQGSFGIPESRKQAQAITWHKDTVTGAQVARLVAYSDAMAVLSATHPTNGSAATVNLTSAFTFGSKDNSVYVQADYNPTTNPGGAVKVIAGDGTSDFLRTADRLNLPGYCGTALGANASVSLITNQTVKLLAKSYSILMTIPGYNTSGGSMPMRFMFYLDAILAVDTGYAVQNPPGFSNLMWGATLPVTTEGSHTVTWQLAASNNPGNFYNYGYGLLTMAGA